MLQLIILHIFESLLKSFLSNSQIKVVSVGLLCRVKSLRSGLAVVRLTVPASTLHELSFLRPLAAAA